MFFVVLFLLASLSYVLYVRYYPIKGVPCIDIHQLSKKTNNVKVDIRDYNTSAKGTVSNSVLMPIAYLRRYHNEIPAKQIYLIAADKVERNLATRMLKQKGFQVIGYTITNCNCQKKSKRVA